MCHTSRLHSVIVATSRPVSVSDLACKVGVFMRPYSGLGDWAERNTEICREFGVVFYSAYVLASKVGFMHRLLLDSYTS